MSFFFFFFFPTRIFREGSLSHCSFLYVFSFFFFEFHHSTSDKCHPLPPFRKSPKQDPHNPPLTNITNVPPHQTNRLHHSRIRRRRTNRREKHPERLSWYVFPFLFFFFTPLPPPFSSPLSSSSATNKQPHLIFLCVCVLINKCLNQNHTLGSVSKSTRLSRRGSRWGGCKEGDGWVGGWVDKIE